jgi:hypothetical protein
LEVMGLPAIALVPVESGLTQDIAHSRAIGYMNPRRTRSSAG